MTEEKNKSLHETSVVLCKIYQELVSQDEIFFPLVDEQIEKIDSIVKTVNASYFGVTRFPDPEDKAAAYFCLIIKDHPLTDGNKRMAVLSLEFYCNELGLKMKLPEGFSLDELAVSVEQSKDEPKLIELVRKIVFG